MNRNKFVKGLSLFLVLATMLCMLTVVSLADAGSFRVTAITADGIADLIIPLPIGPLPIGLLLVQIPHIPVQEMEILAELAAV